MLNEDLVHAPAAEAGPRCDAAHPRRPDGTSHSGGVDECQTSTTDVMGRVAGVNLVAENLGPGFGGVKCSLNMEQVCLCDGRVDVANKGQVLGFGQDAHPAAHLFSLGLGTVPDHCERCRDLELWARCVLDQHQLQVPA